MNVGWGKDLYNRGGDDREGKEIGALQTCMKFQRTNPIKKPTKLVNQLTEIVIMIITSVVAMCGPSPLFLFYDIILK